MSSKRKAEEQLTKDDYERLEANDNDDDNDDSTNSNNNNDGRFSPVQSGYGIQRATAEQMKTRRIIKARRPVAVAESTTTTTTSADNKKDHTDAVVVRPNAFANVKLTAATPALPSSSSGRPVFGASSQYKGFGTTVAAGSGGFSFGGSSGSTSTGGGGGGSSGNRSGFGGFATAAAATATTDGNTTTKPFFGFSKDAATATAGANESSTAPDAAAAAPPPSSSSSVLPDNFVVQSGEEDQVCVLETRSKVFRFGTPTASGPAPTAAAIPTTASTTPTSTSAAAAGAVLSVPPTSTGFRKIEKEITENKESAEKESPAGGAKLEESKETDDEKVANENDSKMTKVEQLNDDSKKEDSALSEPTKVTAKDIKPAASAAAAAADDEEEGEERGHEVDDNDKKKREWVEVGIGQLRVLKPKDKPETKFARLVHRRQPDRKEKPTKVLVNCLLGQESKVQAVSDTHIQVSTFSEQNAALMWLFKFRTNGLAEEFRKCVESVTAEAKSFSASMNTTTSSSSSSSPVKNPENGATETKNALTSPTKQEEDKSPNAVTSQAKEEDNASTTSS